MNDYFDSDSWINEYLEKDEYVKWTGKSEKIFAFHSIYIFMIPFFTIWFGGVIFATVSSAENTISGEEGFFTLIFMIPFWLVGSYFIFSLFILPVLARAKTVYAITNKKVIQKFGKQIKMIHLDPMPQIQISAADRKGRGTIVVGVPVSDRTEQFKDIMPWINKGCISIYDISEPSTVYKYIISM